MRQVKVRDYESLTEAILEEIDLIRHKKGDIKVLREIDGALDVLAKAVAVQAAVNRSAREMNDYIRTLAVEERRALPEACGDAVS